MYDGIRSLQTLTAVYIKYYFSEKKKKCALLQIPCTSKSGSNVHHFYNEKQNNL
jgi:hypothetical protein